MRKLIIPLALLLKELFAHLWLVPKIHQSHLAVTKTDGCKTPGKDLSLNPRPSSVSVRPDFHSSSQEQFCHILEKDTAFLQQ